MNMVPLNAATWRRIDSYLDYALDLSRDELDRWLGTLANQEPGIARTLRELLSERDELEARGFLERPFVDIAKLLVAHELTSLAGKRVGAYTIDRLIDRGGMGEVWLASRSDGRFEGRFAIKFLGGTVMRPRELERFRREGRLLARLGHPNIARLIDAGALDDGQQYLVLEYVDGERIDRFCTERKLSVEARVRLLLDVASAVAHAHANLIIHRDLKPSNVLVTDAGVVKLLDFGIAKLLNSQPPADATVTRLEDQALTPEYAAPEQLLSEIPSTATDVYQLGMLLYVLLTGGHPLELSGSRSERIKSALEGRVPRASEFAGAAAGKELRGDLDAILAMALRRDPAERYPTAAAFADDLERYLRREPVRARRGAALYRAQKFVRRHRFAVIASALAVTGLCGSLVYATLQSHLAASERDRAVALASRNAAVTDFLGTLITEAAESDKPVSVTDLLDRSEALALADTKGSVENRAAVLAMLASRYGALGQTARSARLLATGRSLLTDSPDEVLRAQLTCAHASYVAEEGDLPNAVREIDGQLARLHEMPAAEAPCLLSRASIADDEHDSQGALRYATQALTRLRSMGTPTSAEEAEYFAAVGHGMNLAGRNAEADEYFRQAMQNLRELGRDTGPEAIAIRNSWAQVTGAAGVPRRALELFDEMLSIRAARDPGGRPPGYLVGNRAGMLEALGRYPEALAAHQLSVDLARIEHSRMGELHCLLGLASTAAKMHNRPAAEKYLAEFTSLAGASLPSDGPMWGGRAMILAQLDLADGRLNSARQQFDELLARAGGVTATIGARLGLGEVELASGDATRAADDALIALKASQSLQGGLPYSNLTGASWLLRGRALTQLGQSAEAHEAFVAAAAHLSATVDSGHPALAQARSLASAGLAARAAL